MTLLLPFHVMRIKKFCFGVLKILTFSWQISQRTSQSYAISSQFFYICGSGNLEWLFCEILKCASSPTEQPLAQINAARILMYLVLFLQPSVYWKSLRMGIKDSCNKNVCLIWRKTQNWSTFSLNSDIPMVRFSFFGVLCTSTMIEC